MCRFGASKIDKNPSHSPINPASVVFTTERFKAAVLVLFVLCCAYGHLITKTRLFKYIENFTIKNWMFSDQNSNNVHIFVQNIDLGTC